MTDPAGAPGPGNDPAVRRLAAVLAEADRVFVLSGAGMSTESGIADFRGPNGIWTARQGDIVPGVGRVDSIVRWGKRWIVATSGGLISTP